MKQIMWIAAEGSLVDVVQPVFTFNRSSFQPFFHACHFRFQGGNAQFDFGQRHTFLHWGQSTI